MPGVVALSWFRARVRRAIAPLVPRRDQHHKNLPNTTDMYRAVLPKPRTAISPATANPAHGNASPAQEEGEHEHA